MVADTFAQAAPRTGCVVLVCPGCGRVAGYTARDLRGFMQSGWPRCCGGRMTLPPDDAYAAIAAAVRSQHPRPEQPR